MFMMAALNVIVYYTPVVVLKGTNQRRETMTIKQLVQGCYAVA